jgi:nicotinamide riboside transporter PnuC
MTPLPYGDWITAFLTITYLQLLTMKKWYAWPLGMITQLVWVYLTLSKELYGLTALSCIMFCQFGYGWYNSREAPLQPKF